MPIRDRDGQRVSRQYMEDMANYPDSPNNLLYDKIREGMIDEWEEKWEEYGMIFIEHMHADSLNGGSGLVNFLVIKDDDEADGDSNATELNLDDARVNS